jgi:hypothetical protein
MPAPTNQWLEVKVHHPLFMRYYGNDKKIQPQRSLDELIAIKESTLSGELKPEDFHEYGLRVSTLEAMTPNHERKECG